MDDAVKKEVQHLQQELTRHNHLYHTRDNPEISDAQYDAMMARLIALEAQYPELSRPDSPTHRVGAPPLEVFESARHTLPMFGLDNAFNAEDVREFHQRVCRFLKQTEVTYTAEPKMDGVAVELRYEDGVLVRATTRGDGETGEVITGKRAHHPYHSPGPGSRAGPADTPDSRGTGRGDYHKGRF